MAHSKKDLKITSIKHLEKTPLLLSKGYLNGKLYQVSYYLALKIQNCYNKINCEVYKIKN
jgi:hypothetical protein